MKYESFKAPSFLMFELVQPDVIKPAVKNLPELPIKSFFQQAPPVFTHFLLLIKPWLGFRLCQHPSLQNRLMSKISTAPLWWKQTSVQYERWMQPCSSRVINVFQLFSMDALMQTSVLVSSCFISHRWHESGGEPSLNFSQHNNSQKTWKLLVKFRTKCCKLCSVTLWKAHKDASCEYLQAKMILRFSHGNPALWRIQDP